MNYFGQNEQPIFYGFQSWELLFMGIVYEILSISIIIGVNLVGLGNVLLRIWGDDRERESVVCVVELCFRFCWFPIQ